MPSPQFDPLRRQLARPASRAILGKPRPKDLLASCLGRVKVALPGEEWPQWDGIPAVPLIQINCTELPVRPPSLSDVALITLFAPAADEDMDSLCLPGNAANGDRWLLRAYPSLDGLIPLVDPEEEDYFGEMSITWEAIDQDYPNLDYKPADADVDPDVWQREFPCALGTKVGGWPATIQSDIFWAPWNKHPANPEYVLQVDSEPDIGMMFGDGGTVYIGRGTGDSQHVWCLEWQCF